MLIDVGRKKTLIDIRNDHFSTLIDVEHCHFPMLIDVENGHFWTFLLLCFFDK